MWSTGFFTSWASNPKPKLNGMCMPTSVLTKLQIKLLTYGIYTLIFVIGLMTTWQGVQLSAMNSKCVEIESKMVAFPDKFVRLERYKNDESSTQCALTRIETKLDKLIMDK